MGYAGPYTDDASKINCGVLITLLEDVNTIGTLLDLSFTDGKGNTAAVEILVMPAVNDGIIEFPIDTSTYYMVVFNVESDFNVIEFLWEFYKANTFFSVFSGACFLGATAFDVYLGGLLWFEYKRDELYLSSDSRFNG